MRLYIAEKPSLGRAIADVLPSPQKRGAGFIRVGNGDVVSWCIGHLLEQVEPEAYDPALKQWRFEHLPIVPEQWRLQPKPKTRQQLTVLRKWVKEADELVHAGDPDREGQLLVDQVIDYLGVKGEKRAAVQRCLINDLNPAAVKRALAQLRPNSDFIALSTSALARSRADWLYGINLTRAYTLQGRKAGYDGLLSVGRVQTPLLGMVVRRDQAIRGFTSKPFYQVLAHMLTQSAEGFIARWQPSDACQPYMDEEGRVLSKPLAENVITRITGQAGRVTRVDQTPKSQPPPLPYSLSTLQIDAAKRFGFNAKQVLDLSQVLYERHKLITYPRSDSRYLPEEHFPEGPQVLAAVRSNCAALATAVDAANCELKSRAWNDKKVEAHHALIPTAKTHGHPKLSPDEQKLYKLIAERYILQFYPKWDYTDTTVELTIAGGLFISKARVHKNLGWKSLLAASHSRSTHAKEEQQEDSEFREERLPELTVGELLHCDRGELLERQTQPPKAFTDATLLAAMTGIARFVQDPQVRQILRDTDGLGTEATRAGIIELLFKRGFLQRAGKQIRATDTGCALINSLPDVATTPDMTAQWESILNGISLRKNKYSEFMQPLIERIEQLVQNSEVASTGWPETGAKSAYRTRAKRRRPRAAS